MPKRIYIETFGCQMNDYESDRTEQWFVERHGYEPSPSPAEADLVLMNTCSIREKADQKALSFIGRLRELKEANPRMVIAVGGCMAQIVGEEIQRKFPYVDIVFGTHQWNQIPALVEKVMTEKKRFLEIDLFGWRNYKFLSYVPENRTHPVSDLVTVQNGCNKFCTFCLVPHTRGREVSRPPQEIINEVEALTELGVRDVMLLGQNVNSYGQDRSGEIGFPELLRRVSAVPRIQRIRFMTSHPAVLTQEMIDEMAEIEKLCAHFHLPLQSGSDRILISMRREHTFQAYLELVTHLRKRIPDVSLTTDFIVGFPGESDEDFHASLRALEEIEFDDSFSFCFSPRPLTKAAAWEKEFVPRPLAEERLARLQHLQGQIQQKNRQAWVGQTVEVLLEGRAKREGQLAGRTSQNHTVNLKCSPELVGQNVNVKLTECLSYSFRGMVEP